MLLYVDAQYASPYAMSVFVALQEKQLPFRMRTIDLAAGQQRDAPYATASHTQRVPTLVEEGDGQGEGFSLSESSAITEYLHDTQPGAPLYPADPRARARARQVQAWLRSDLRPLRQERPTEVVFYGRRFAPLSPAGQGAADKLITAAGAWLTHGGDHLFGAWCIADTDLALMLQRVLAHGDAVPPALARYAQAQWAHPAVQRWLQQARPPL